jgi:putative ABC transport system permease protein
MFITYLAHELRRRLRQAICIALGLALGVGLVITVSAASKGVSAAQGSVLQSLYGVATDITVTQAPTAGSGGGQRFSFTGGLGKSNSVSRNVLVDAGPGTMKSSAVAAVSGLRDVSGAVGSLTLNDVTFSGSWLLRRERR